MKTIFLTFVYPGMFIGAIAVLMLCVIGPHLRGPEMIGGYIIGGIYAATSLALLYLAIRDRSKKANYD